ncbi:Spc98 family-domain-containing protein [Suillus placidus]|uniref:Spc98 family-domain-containing protein n=1 Tax=Suillus placidus TaxID=48579 RepID=A0A9P7CYN3_9AGAM|nr:Spc98 family-domain-containing protein [Suillus placidus]
MSFTRSEVILALHENVTGHLAAQIKRHPLQPQFPSNASLKFTNLLSRLSDQPVLSRKPRSLHLLHSLASSPRQPTSSPFLASLQAPLRPSTTQDRPSMLLTEYYRLIAVLESQMGNAPNSAPGSQSDPVGEETDLALRRLDVWITEWRLHMRMMSVCVKGARGAQGGALVNPYPFVSTSFFNTLHKWLFSGELYDPHSEFFVSINPSLAHLQGLHPSSLAGGIDAFGEDSVSADRSEGGGGLRVWETKYHFRKEMLPMFVGENFGRKIFSTGKSLSFIRYSCHDSDWVATRKKISNTGAILKYSDIADWNAASTAHTTPPLLACLRSSQRNCASSITSPRSSTTSCCRGCQLVTVSVRWSKRHEAYLGPISWTFGIDDRRPAGFRVYRTGLRSMKLLPLTGAAKGLFTNTATKAAEPKGKRKVDGPAGHSSPAKRGAGQSKAA